MKLFFNTGMNRMTYGYSAVMTLATVRYARLSLANVESKNEPERNALGNQRRVRLPGGASISSSSFGCFGLGAPLALALLAAFAFTLAFALGVALGVAFGFADAAPFGVKGLAKDFENQAGNGSGREKIIVTWAQNGGGVKIDQVMELNGEKKSRGLQP